MKDVTVHVFVENAAAREFIDPYLAYFVIVIALAFGDLFWPERDMKIVIEIARRGRYPLDAPPHSLFVGLDLGQRRTRDGDVADVAMLEVDEDAVDMIELEGATNAALAPAGTEHEMLDDQLAASAEEVGEGLLPVRPVENIRLLDLDPR